MFQPELKYSLNPSPMILRTASAPYTVRVNDSKLYARKGPYLNTNKLINILSVIIIIH